MSLKPPPPPVKSEPGSFAWMDWYKKLYDYLNTAGSVVWSTINFTGSKLTDIVIRLHSNLQGIAGTGEYHISATEATKVTSLLNGIITGINYLGFSITPVGVPLTTPGTLFYDNADGNQTLSLVMGNGITTQQIGEESFIRVKATSAITDGQVVMFTGSVGASGALTGAPATGLVANTAFYVIGVATESIPLNGWGYITYNGNVRGIDTTGGAEAWVDGQILYLDPTVPGKLTKTLPVAPNPKVTVAVVVKASATIGTLSVRLGYGGRLGDFEGDIHISSLVAGNILQYSGTNSRWENVAFPGITNLTGPITSIGNATAIASQTGTGTKFVMDISPALVTPNVGVASGTSLAATGGVGVGGASVGSSGVAFPATAVAIADVNTLDDYEEGTWTPIDASGAGLTLTTADCIYTKIGRQVICKGSITYPVTASGAGASIGGLPFASGAYGGSSIQGFFGVRTFTIVSDGLYGGASSTNFSIDKNHGGAVALNSDLSGSLMYFTVIYNV